MIRMSPLAVLAGMPLVFLPALLLGCAKPAADPVTREGVIFSVEYERADGRTAGFTRVNRAGAVPGGNGSWNVDAYGRLTGTGLFISRPQRKDIGPEFIPAQRLVRVQFGDGGIADVNENRPAPP